MEQKHLNNVIELVLSSNQIWEINEHFGISALNGYLSELSMLSAGVPFDQLGIQKRREQSIPRILAHDANNIVSAFDISSKSAIKPGAIAILQLKGVMRSQDGISSYGMDTFIGWLRDAYENPNIQGVIIETESGGGESTAGTKLQVAISEKNKPVVAFAYMAASAAYRGILGVDEIIGAGDASEFGSLGTFVPIDKKALTEYRERFEFVYASQAPNKNIHERGLLSGDIGPMQEYVDRLTAQFHNEVKNMRTLTGSSANIKHTLSGAMFPAQEAKERGLIDSVGNLQYAIKRVKKMK